ncbi:hypothetical protein BTO20_30340 [Mycobacterium dioxanotrophicus]|uniref:Uncharacterized protein n=1 Tax=Mycobacterium dioxanotrophicus TaxID=482462 RepID=A0A1Y0CAL1_9MYCO|nr:hypothetical protein [Mycobacterium dioxanotrophicus]ART72283.1 hypothetical protein BTO20_30340 [Mycobacterium dioxanotrophicus]
MTRRRVIFPDPDIWTRKEHHMPDQPAAIRRPLTDRERALLDELTRWVVTEQTGWTDQQAVDWLEATNEKIGMHRHGDSVNAYVSTGNGHVILHVTREWLAYWAHTDEQISDDELRGYVQFFRQENGNQ